jgi:hypothetical protein
VLLKSSRFELFLLQNSVNITRNIYNNSLYHITKQVLKCYWQMHTSEPVQRQSSLQVNSWINPTAPNRTSCTGNKYIYCTSFCNNYTHRVQLLNVYIQNLKNTICWQWRPQSMNTGIFYALSLIMCNVWKWSFTSTLPPVLMF